MVGPRRELLGLVSIADIAVVAKDLIDAVLKEETQHSLKRTHALTGGKRIIKRIRRPTQMDRIPDAEVFAKRGPSRPGPVRNVYRNPAGGRKNRAPGAPAGRRGRPARQGAFATQGPQRGKGRQQRQQPSTFYPVGGGAGSSHRNQ